MKQIIRRACLAAPLAAGFTGSASAQRALTWDEVRARFEANNPTFFADQIGIDESKAQQITAYLRPNPQLTLAADGTQIASDKGVWKPFAGTYETPTISYLQLLARTAAQAGIKTGERAERDAHFGGESRRSVEDSAL